MEIQNFKTTLQITNLCNITPIQSTLTTTATAATARHEIQNHESIIKPSNEYYKDTEVLQELLYKCTEKLFSHPQQKLRRTLRFVSCCHRNTYKVDLSSDDVSYTLSSFELPSLLHNMNHKTIFK